ncbi:MAG: hypothetical protein PSX37_05640, partial [bacterium]|nr:hypothetical protein [bacterium]
MVAGRSIQLRGALDVLVSGERVEVRAADCSDPWELAVSAFAASWRLQHDVATEFAERAIHALPEPRDGDREAAVLAYAA